MSDAPDVSTEFLNKLQELRELYDIGALTIQELVLFSARAGLEAAESIYRKDKKEVVTL